MNNICNILNAFPDRIGDKRDAHIFTPVHMAKEMVEAIPNWVWTKDRTFLDIACKSGIFLHEIYKKLMNSEDLVLNFPNKEIRRKHIINNQLFGIAVDDICKVISERTLYGFVPEKSNIISFNNNYTYIMQNKDIKYLTNTLQEEFKLMKFDIVIGNPPYNKGMDLDFVHKGYQLSSNYTVMITPAKWQTCPDDYSGCASKTIDYKQFRELYVKHMFKVCFYPDCVDVFNVSQSDGITWYAMDKKTHDKCEVINICNTNSKLNSVAIRSLRERESLHNIGAEIVHSLGNYNRFKFSKGMWKRYQVWTNSQLAKGGGARGGVGLLANDGATQCVGISRIIDSKLGESSPSGASTCSFSSDIREECESFISWLNTRFTRFFVAINISKLTGIINDESFRFVPAPPTDINGKYKFDHIYTDQELYDYYKIPKQYQEVIESVIKERK